MSAARIAVSPSSVGAGSVYTLRRLAWKLQARPNARKCGRVRVRPKVQIFKDGIEGRVRCESASCPVCADRRLLRDADEFAERVRLAGWRGKRLLTLSLSWAAGDSLAEILDALEADWRHLTAGAPWGRWKTRLKLDHIRTSHESHDGRWRAEFRVAVFLAGDSAAQAEFVLWLRERCKSSVKLMSLAGAGEVGQWLAPRVGTQPSSEQESREPWDLIREDPVRFAEWALAACGRRRRSLSKHARGVRPLGKLSQASNSNADWIRTAPAETVQRPAPLAEIEGLLWDAIVYAPSFSEPALITAAVHGGQNAVDLLTRTWLAEVRAPAAIFPLKKFRCHVGDRDD